MKLKVFTLIAIFFLGFQLNAHAVNPVKVNPSEKEAKVLEEEGVSRSSLKEKLDGFTAKKRAKIEKKVNKIKKKMDRKRANADSVNDTGGVELGLVILLIGLLVAILGFAGVADILVTIGIIVLIVGLVLWLLNAI